jgi:hypothetical protein
MFHDPLQIITETDARVRQPLLWKSVGAQKVLSFLFEKFLGHPKEPYK